MRGGEVIRIRAEQWESMRQSRIGEFQEQLARTVLLRRPEWCDGGVIEHARRVAEDILDKAGSHGIFMAEDVPRFFDFVLHYGLDYHGQSELTWALDILNAPGLTGDGKLDALDSERRNRQ